MANKKLKAPVKIPVEKIRPFEGHPYKVLDNDEMSTLIESMFNNILSEYADVVDVSEFIKGNHNQTKEECA